LKIVYVHGIAQEGHGHELKGDWDKILESGLRQVGLAWPQGVVSAAPFYGDLLARKTAQADKGDIFGLIRRGSTPQEDQKKLEFYRDFLGEIAEVQGIHEEDLVDGDDLIEKGVWNWRPVNALLRMLNRSEAIARLSIERFTRDVYYYLNADFIRSYVDEVVQQGIPTDEPCVVVAHSLGTVVSYNVLLARGNVENVRLWVTLGSPLGIAAVYRLLPSAGGRRVVPFGVRAWYNARDPVDVVALNEIPESHYAGPPMVENASHVHNRTGNRHGIAGYLNDALVARRIHAATFGP
jgi:hypothetical protein